MPAWYLDLDGEFELRARGWLVGVVVGPGAALRSAVREARRSGGAVEVRHCGGGELVALLVPASGSLARV